MKKRWTIPFILLTAIALIIQTIYFKPTDAVQSPEQNGSALSFVVNPRPDLTDIRPIGLNLSSWNTWGAEEYAHNILFNPGFEGKIDRMLVTVNGSGNDRFFDVKGWGQPDGYWKEASFEVRTGDSSGAKGTIINSLEKGKDDLPEYQAAAPLPPLKDKDVILLMKNPDPNPIGNWWLPKPPQTLVLADPTQHRPGSSGVQSVVLSPTKQTPADLINFIDHLTQRAGKLILINGPWRLKFWAKAEGDHPHLQIDFKRLNQTSAFLTQSIVPTHEWKEYVFDFEGRDTGPAQILMLKFSATGQNSKIWMDDVWLGSMQQENESAFRKEIPEMIKKFKPSFLRDWQGQAADSFENRIADQYGRKDFIGRVAGNAPADDYAYSIPDFLNLCEEVGANPWIIAPTVLLDSEYEKLGSFLSAYAAKSRFKEVYVEFGNENWNWIFKPAGIPFPEPHGQLAEKAFQHIAKGAGGFVNLIKVVNGQHANPELAIEYLKSAPSADVLAIAPYFFLSLDANVPEKQALERLFTVDEEKTKKIAEKVQALNKKLAVYEINFHTTQGNANSIERNGYVAGTVSGAALAKNLLANMRSNAQPQMVFSFSQFDTKVSDLNEYVPLWGITRDVSPTKRSRPTGLALAMLNEAIGNTAHQVIAQGADAESAKITAVAFSSDKGWSAAIVSSLPTPIEIEIAFPEGARPIPDSMIVLESNSLFATNEESEQVKAVAKPLDSGGRVVRLSIPAWGFVVLPPKPSR